MTPERMKEAIALGNDAKAAKKFLEQYTLERGSVGWNTLAQFGTFSTPFSRVVEAAYTARKKYKPFSESDVTPEMIAAEWHVYGFSKATTVDGRPVIINVEALAVLPRKSPDRSQAFPALQETEIMHEYQNLLGATFPGRSATAVVPTVGVDRGE
jgi:hypothetical protein